MRKRLTSLPHDLDPAVRALAGGIFKDARTTGQKIAAAVNYFHTNYEYKLGIKIPGGVDPLTYFLLKRPAAHCEYFAAGAAMLLRIAGVPTRYVKGFVVGEYNTYGGYWVARERDAHAWVEAYDESRGWVTVEATPANGVPSVLEKSRPAQWADYLKFLLQKLRVILKTQGVKGLLIWLADCLPILAAAVLDISPFGVLVKLAAFALLLCLLYRRHRRSTPPRQRDPLIESLHALLLMVESNLGRRGIVRRPAETLRQFSRRAGDGLPADTERAIRSWYEDYAAIRYRGSVTQEAIEKLREKLPVQGGGY